MEEWRLRRGAGARMQDKLFPILLKGSRYADRLPIGKPEIIQNFKPDRLKKFYTDWYRPDLMAVVAVGDFDKAAIESADQDALRLDSGAAGAAAAADLRRAGSSGHASTRSSTDKETTDDDASRSTRCCRRARRASVGVLPAADGRPAVLRHAVGAVRRDRAEARRAVPAGLRRPRLFLARTEGERDARRAGQGGRHRARPGGAAHRGRARARFGFTATELDRQKQQRAARATSACVAEKDNRVSGQPRRRVHPQLPRSTRRCPAADDEYALHQRFLPEITLDEINRLAQGLVPRSQPPRHRHRAGEDRAGRCPTRRSWRP